MTAGALQFQSSGPAPQVHRDSFGELVQSLRDLPFDWTVYPAARALWALWTSDANAEETSWQVFIGPQMKLAGLAVASEQTSPSDRPYYVIDESVPREEAAIFEVSARTISFGASPRPCFWGLYTYLRRVRCELSQIQLACRSA